MQVTIPLAQLNAALEFAPVSDVRHYLNGVFVDPRSRNLIATNGRAVYVGRPGSVAWPDADSGGDGFIIPRAVCVELVKAGKAARVKGEHSAVLEVADGLVTVVGLRVAPFAPVDGKFPDWRRVYPSTLSGVAATYDPTYLMSLVKAGKALGVKHADYGFNFIQNGKAGAVAILAGGCAHVVVMPFRDDATPSSFQRFEV